MEMVGELMLYNLIITGLLVSSFFICIFSFFVGLKWGKSICKGNIPTIPNPIKPIITMVNKDKNNIISESIDNIMSYSEDVAMDHIKKERR